jgi:hypothetical protein
MQSPSAELLIVSVKNEGPLAMLNLMIMSDAEVLANTCMNR